MLTVPEYFGSLVFDSRVMKARLPEDVYRSLKHTIQKGAKLDPSVANAVAAAMKDWAVENGATHFTADSTIVNCLPRGLRKGIKQLIAVEYFRD